MKSEDSLLKAQVKGSTRIARVWSYYKEAIATWAKGESLLSPDDERKTERRYLMSRILLSRLSVDNTHVLDVS